MAHSVVSNVAYSQLQTIFTMTLYNNVLTYIKNLMGIAQTQKSMKPDWCGCGISTVTTVPVH